MDDMPRPSEYVFVGRLQAIAWMRQTPGWSLEDYDDFFADLQRCAHCLSCDALLAVNAATSAGALRSTCACIHTRENRRAAG